MQKNFSQNRSRTGKGRPGKLIGWAAWLSGVDRLDCPTCEETWKEFGGVPPCEACRPNFILAENEPIIKIYCQCSGPLAITPMAAIKLAEIEDAETCLNSVQLLAAEIQKLRDAAREKRRK